MTFELFFGLYVLCFIAYPILVWLLPKLYLDKLPGMPDLRFQRQHESVRWVTFMIHALVMFMPYVNMIGVVYLIAKVLQLKRRLYKSMEDV